MGRNGGEIRLVASSRLPTRFGVFTLYGFHDPVQKEDVSVIAMPEITQLKQKHKVPVRIHSACHTGDTLSSLRCDCQAQLHAAQRYIARRRCGIIIYLPQEGRGIGLMSKIQAYHLQDSGMDTAEANTHLGFANDLRDYRTAAEIVQCCELSSIILLTNNPDKVAQMEAHGVHIAKRIPLRVGRNKHNRSYLRVKKDKFKHDM